MDEPRPSNQEVQTALAAICDSQVFANKKTLPELLACIVNHWLAGEDINEDVLLTEVFKRDLKSAETNIVRSNAINLRAALAEYYDVEGRRDEVRIAIPRGTYNAQISYSAAIRERAELDRREAVLTEKEREIERRHAEFDKKVAEFEALHAKREAAEAVRQAEYDRKIAELETKLTRQIQRESKAAETRAQSREERIVSKLNTTIMNYTDDGGF
jgi:hypothetical protein